MTRNYSRHLQAPDPVLGVTNGRVSFFFTILTFHDPVPHIPVYINVSEPESDELINPVTCSVERVI